MTPIPEAVLQAILASAEANRWVAVSRYQYRIIASAETTDSALQAASRAGFSRDDLLLVWTGEGVEAEPAANESSAEETRWAQKKAGV